MCNEFQRNKQLKDAIEEFDRRGLALFKWRDGLVSNMDAQPSVRIRDSAFVVRLAGGQAYLTAVISTDRAPPGAGTSTESPTFLPISALARGEVTEIEPFFMSASYWPTMR